jgi:hypothetical protein
VFFLQKNINDDDDGDFADDEFKEQLVHRHLFVLCN